MGKMMRKRALRKREQFVNNQIEQIVTQIEEDTKAIQQEIEELGGVKTVKICTSCKHEGYVCELAGLFFGYKVTRCANWEQEIK